MTSSPVSSSDSSPALDEVLGKLVHDVRTPLSVIAGYAALIAEMSPEAPPPEFAEAISRSARQIEAHLAALVDGAAGPGDAEAAESDVETGDRKPFTLLCVEDDTGTVELVERVLGRDRELTMVVADDGERGLDLAVEHRPDAVLLDLHVGGSDGEAVLRELRSDARTASVPVVILSGGVTEARAGDLLVQGADAVVSKPFLPQELRDTVQAVLADGHRPERAAPSQAADEVLDVRYLEALEELEGPDGDGAVVSLVQTMVRDARSYMTDLRTALDEGDLVRAARAAHSLGGGIGNLGAHLVVQRCRDLEHWASNGDAAATAASIEDLESALGNAESALCQRFPALRA